jgi:outer membrane protein assembly factor BamA
LRRSTISIAALAVLAVLVVRRPARADDDRGGFVVLPGVGYTPDTGPSLGAATLWTFRVGGGEHPSKLSSNGQVSLRGEAELNLDPEVWLDHDRWVVAFTSQIARREESFFGLGNDTTEADREDYDVDRLDTRLEVVRAITRELFVGVALIARFERIREVEPGGQLARDEVDNADGGSLAGAGLVLRWDTRDKAFWPRSGWSVSAAPRLYGHVLGGDARFVCLTVDGSVCFNPWFDHVVALDGRVDLHRGDTPFDELARLGGKRILRGMLEGRYRDRDLLFAQAEYRLPLFWRVGAVGFAGLGRVAPRVRDLPGGGFKTSVGGGLRFTVDRDDEVHIRFDAALADGDHGFYLTLLEAF